MYTIGPLTTSNFMGWVVKGKESPSRWGPTLQNFSKIIPVFLGRISLFWLISDKLLIIDICKSFVKERRTTPSNLRLGKTLKKWLWPSPPLPSPPTILPRFVEIGIGKPCQTGRLVGPINNFFSEFFAVSWLSRNWIKARFQTQGLSITLYKLTYNWLAYNFN